jgi:prepilin-type N-terminal cleavage/methylation domain-containing protein
MERNHEKGFTLTELLMGLAIVVLAFLPLVGYVGNIVRLCHCDFAAPYKSEVIRVIGIFVPPVGVVTGFCKIEDK